MRESNKQKGRGREFQVEERVHAKARRQELAWWGGRARSEQRESIER